MALSQRPFFPPSAGESARSRGGRPVLAVGRRVFVTSSNEALSPVILTDGNGSTTLATLSGGAEVEIIAWQPRGANGTRYRVRSTAGDVEGWVPAANLRAPAPVNEAKPAPSVPEPPRTTKAASRPTRKGR